MTTPRTTQISTSLESDDPIYEAAVHLVLSQRQPTVSFLQRELGVGFARAAKFLDQMECCGVVSDMSPNGVRRVLMPVGTLALTPEQYGPEFCQNIVTDSWRSFLTAAALGSPEQGTAAIASLERRSHEIAQSLPPERREQFLQTIEGERSRIAAEYASDEKGLKRRLGVSLPEAQANTLSTGRGRQSLSDLAVKTAVRATVWESITSIFRLFR